MVHCHSYTTPTKDQYIHYHCIPVSNGSRLLIMFMFNVTHCGFHFFFVKMFMSEKFSSLVTTGQWIKVQVNDAFK